MAKPNIALGISSAIAVIFVWSAFIVFSRAGVISNMTAYDVTALRFLEIDGPHMWSDPPHTIVEVTGQGGTDEPSIPPETVLISPDGIDPIVRLTSSKTRIDP